MTALPPPPQPYGQSIAQPYGPPHGQQVHGQQQYAAVGHLDLTVQGNRFTSSMIPPDVTVNGRLLVPAYGRRQIPVPAGRVRVDAVCTWTKRFGEASLEVDVAPGQTVPVFYVAPMHVFAKGSIGHVPQRRRGVMPFVALLSAIVVVPVLIAVVAAVLS